MGIKGADKVVYKLKNVVARELDVILNTKLPSTTNVTSAPPKKRIDCDVSCIIHHLSSRHGRVFTESLVTDVANFLKDLAADTGYVVTAILDGDVRPQSKRDSFRRRFDSTIGRINSYYCRQSAMKISSKPSNEQTIDDKNNLEKYNKASKHLESKNTLVVPNNLLVQLQDALKSNNAHEIDSKTGGYVNRNIIKAEFEADYVLGYRYRNKQSDLIFSKDSDMVPLCGTDCIVIRDMQTRKSGSHFVYEVMGGCNERMQSLKDNINKNIPESKIKYSKAEYPVFATPNQPPYVSAIIAIGIGCDCLPGGVQGIGPKKIWDEIQNFFKVNRPGESEYKRLHKKLIQTYLSKGKSKELTEKYLDIYQQAWLYQPAIEYGKRNDVSSFLYLFEKPKTLSTYLSDFRHCDSEISLEEETDDECCTLSCNGVQHINLPHKFLKCEGHFTCTKCTSTFCSTCGYSPSKDKKKSISHDQIYYQNMNNELCMNCYKEQIFLPYDVGEVDEVLSLQEMKTYLHSKNQSIGNKHNVCPHEIQELYEYVKDREGNNENDDPINNVPFPLFPAKSLTNPKRTVEGCEKYVFGDVLAKYNLIHGGRLMNLPEIEDKHIAPLLEVLCSVIRYNDKHKYATFKSRIFEVVPSIFRHFSNGSRVGCGFRLLERCIRHALDPKTPSLMYTTMEIVEQEDKMALVLKNNISASMKDSTYQVKVAFNNEEVIAATCNCLAGGLGDDRIVCVHNLPLIYQLTMLLDDGLAEHILIELCTRWNGELEDLIKKDVELYEKTKENIILLMIHHGADDVVVENARNRRTIDEMLQTYNTGTEKSKRIPPPPKVKELRPLRDLEICGICTQVENRQKKRRPVEQSEKESDKEEDEQVIKIDPYTHTLLPMKCDFCDRGITTTHVCRHPGGKRRIENKEEMICGLAFCIECSGEEENRTQCKHHCSTSSSTNSSPTSSATSDKKPAYLDTYISIKALDFDIKTINFSGFDLLKERVKDTLSQMSEKSILGYIKDKKRQWKNMFSNLLHARDKPYRDTQVPRKKNSLAGYQRNKRKGKNDIIQKQVSNTTQVCTYVSTTATSTTPTANNSKPKSVWKRGPRKHCCFVGCKHTERTDPNITTIKKIPKNERDVNVDAPREVMTYFSRKFEREYILKKCKKEDKGGTYYLCNHHEMERINKTIPLKKKNKTRDTTVDVPVDFMAPTGKGMKAEMKATKRSKGLGGDRLYRKQVETLNNNITNLDTDGSPQNKTLVNAATDNATMAMQSYEEIDRLMKENESLRKELNELKMQQNNDVNENRSSPVRLTKKGKIFTNTLKNKPTISYHDLKSNPNEVKRRTGFQSIEHLLAYTIIVCDGDFDKLKHTTTSLTWLEEWFFYYEYIWGKSLRRWWDAEATYKTSRKLLRRIFQAKLDMACSCRQLWPRYASFEEDFKLMKKKWKDKYKGKRIIMWDDTNVNFQFKPSGADEQRLTFSVYYAGNCAKGGVFLQLCGWTGVENLWVGATSDSHYQEHTKIFQRQKTFADNDPICGKIIPFTNIFDKGYRVNLPAWRAGRQQVIQPIFARSDKKFRGRETIQSADVATDRSGNERAVKRCKLSGYIDGGLHQAGSPITMDDAWLAWSFQTNFMYKPVL